MILNDSILKTSERVQFALRELYLSNGYRQYRMSKFEEYDLYAGNKDFLVSDHVITFTDTDGKLLALKPDVTLSIIKNSPDLPEETCRIFYDENVYRVSKGTGTFREIKQTGVECFGRVGEDEICETLRLAAESLKRLDDSAVLAVSDLGVLTQLIDRIGLDVEGRKELLSAVGDKNADAILQLSAACNDETARDALLKLLHLQGPLNEEIDQVERILQDADCDANSAFCRVVRHLAQSELGSVLRIDFSVIGDVLYYNGIVFHGYLRGVPDAVLSGGQYDFLMKRLGRKSGAIGFAVYTDVLDRVSPSESNSVDTVSYLNIALPKGRLGEKIYAMFADAGYECPGILEPNRKLIFENAEKRVRYFWVKPSDVAIYVERGAADIGVAGKDILAEYAPDVYELLDLKKGKCRMCVAGPKTALENAKDTLRVATKFTNIAKAYYRSLGRDIDIIHLNGSIEIAPILGLSDVIVDIVETGATLRENNLDVLETIMPISARLIANKSSQKFKSQQISELVRSLSATVEEEL